MQEEVTGQEFEKRRESEPDGRYIIYYTFQNLEQQQESRSV